MHNKVSNGFPRMFPRESKGFLKSWRETMLRKQETFYRNSRIHGGVDGFLWWKPGSTQETQSFLPGFLKGDAYVTNGRY